MVDMSDTVVGSGIPAVAVLVEAVSFTPGREPVVIQYRARDAKSGPLAQSQLHHTTQPALERRCVVGATTWGDDEIKAELRAHLNECGMIVEIADRPQSPEQPVK